MVARKHLLQLGVVALAALVLWVVYVSSKQMARNQRIEDEVSLLQNEADKIRRENETLGEKIQYFSSTDFREREAKEKLGMKKEREEVIVIQSRPEVESDSEEVLMKRTPAGEGFSLAQPNYRKWWEVFFGNEE